MAASACKAVISLCLNLPIRGNMSEYLRLAVFSDIHANAVALEAVLDDLHSTGGLDYLVAAGDLLTDGSQPCETWHLLQQARSLFVRGNHDEYLLGNYQDAHPQFWEEIEVTNRWTLKHLSPDIKQHIKAMPLHLRFSPAPGHDLLVMHATFKSCHHHVAQVYRSDDELEEKYGGAQAEVIVFGHYHESFNFRRGNTHFVNVASVSLPRDKQPLAAYTLFTWRRNHWDIEQRRIPYDRDKFVRHLLSSDTAARQWQLPLLGVEDPLSEFELKAAG